MRRRGGPAALGAALLVLATACGDADLDSWSAPASVQRVLDDTDPPSTRGLTSLRMALDDSSRVELEVPAVYRVKVRGEVSEGSKTIPFAVGGWVLVTAPYDPDGASGNDINVVDIGIKTDTSPLVGAPGALWFGTNASIMSDLDLGVASNAAAVDIVAERVDADVVHAELITQLARISTLNVYNVDAGPTAQINNVLTGTVSLRFAPDGSAITGRIDVGGTSGVGAPAVSSEYHASFTGSRF